MLGYFIWAYLHFRITGTWGCGMEAPPSSLSALALCFQANLSLEFWGVSSPQLTSIIEYLHPSCTIDPLGEFCFNKNPTSNTSMFFGLYVMHITVISYIWPKSKIRDIRRLPICPKWLLDFWVGKPSCFHKLWWPILQVCPKNCDVSSPFSRLLVSFPCSMFNIFYVCIIENEWNREITKRFLTINV